ncbi:hypothetical protein WJX84_009573 [Apatococcus fuscideae]|uniref:Major facilitator superfamily (MFS) profile domain-containing protein n=1 Tax=Apatococcus fuscideae TaxID=2026836 RepID=A0AAW1TGG8_9CHLO
MEESRRSDEENEPLADPKQSSSDFCTSDSSQAVKPASLPAQRAAAWTNDWYPRRGNVKLWLKDERVRTTLLINLASIMERTDEQILPAVYRWIGAAFHATPSQLGNLTFCRALVQAVASPLGGFAGHYYNRAAVTAVGCLLWGFMTAGFSATQTVQQGYIFWAINGIGLSLVIPNGQSLTADYFQPAQRGKAFGALYLTGAVGATLGALYATNIGDSHPLGMEGWRFAFLSVAAVSLTIGVLNLLYAADPRCQPGQLRITPSAGEAQLSPHQLLREMGSVVKIPTFLIIIVQGILGSTPWNALVFLTLYMQLLGMSDTAAAAMMALFLGGTALGGLLGGFVGDAAARRFPSHGRILVCQFSVVSGVPLSLLLLKGLPMNGALSTVGLYACVMLALGLLISWAAPACNNPIFAEIVPPDLRNMIYAFDRSFEGAIAACGAPFVGWLAEYMGFEGPAATEGAASASTEPVAADLDKAKALGNALLICMAVPWFLCFVFYSGLHLTYPRDKRAAMTKAGALQLSMVQMSGPEPGAESDSPHLDRPEGALSSSLDDNSRHSQGSPSTSIDQAVAHHSAARLAARPNASPVRPRSEAPPAAVRPAGGIPRAPHRPGPPGKPPSGPEVGPARAGSPAPSMSQQGSAELGKPSVDRLRAPKRD